MASKEQKSTLFVRKLPPTVTKSDLDSHFGGIGPLRHTIVVTEPGTETCRGFGFVTFAIQEDAQTALKSLNGSCIRGRRISLVVAKKRQRREENDMETALAREKRRKEPVKQTGAKKGSLAMRTVLLTSADKDGQLTEDDAKQAVGADDANAGFESCVMSANSREARCTFSSWALAGKAAAAAHGSKYNAVIEALRGGKQTRLIVRNLPFLIDEVELRNRFQGVAPLRELRLAPANILKEERNRKRKSSKVAVDEESKEDDAVGKNQQKSSSGSATTRCGGYAFVEYFLVADAKFAISKLNGIKVGGRVIAVDLAIGKAEYKAQEQEDENEDENEVKSESEKDVENGNSDDAEDADADDSDTVDGQGEDASLGVSPSAKKVKKSAFSTEEELSRTVFVRNLLFETSAPELWKAMEQEFGKVEQAVLVTHSVTQRPRGTAFVRFADSSSVEKAVRRAGAGDTTKQELKNEKGSTDSSMTDGFSLQGRQLMISTAVDKSKAKDFGRTSKARKDSDPRNLRLAWIGVVKGDSPEARGLSKEDLARRAKAVKEKKVKLERNPNVYVSDVRLCVRNLPKDFDEKFLKHMFLCAAREQSSIKSEKNGHTSGVEDDEPTRKESDDGDGRPHQPYIDHVTIARDPERKDRSKGYGFVQYQRHDDALRALEFLNNNPRTVDWLIKQKPKALKIDMHRERLMRKQWGNGRRLMVEFALEDTRKVQIIKRIKERGRKLAEEHKRKRLEEEDVRPPDGKRKKQKRGVAKNETTVAGHGQSDSHKISGSEKRAALKRERARASTKNHEKKAHDRPVQESETTKRQNEETSKPKEESRKQNDKYDLASIKALERPDPKPKKPRKKRKAAEIAEDNKFDRLLLTYKQKLAKTGTLTQPTESTASDALVSKPRWFEQS